MPGMKKKEKKRKNKELKNKELEPTHITFLLDETGSMMSIKDDTIGGFNSYISKLQQSGQKFLFSLTKFDSRHYTTVYDGVDIRDVKPLDNNSYNPGASTPLIDSAVKAIHDAERRSGKSDKVIVVILTDGHENCSKEYTSETLRGLVTEKQKKDWSFLFLGADMDAFAEAHDYNFSTGTTLSYKKGKTMDTFLNVAESAIRYSNASRGARAVASNFTTQERTTSGDEDYEKWTDTVGQTNLTGTSGGE